MRPFFSENIPCNSDVHLFPVGFDRSFDPLDCEFISWNSWWFSCFTFLFDVSWWSQHALVLPNFGYASQYIGSSLGWTSYCWIRFYSPSLSKSQEVSQNYWTFTEIRRSLKWEWHGGWRLVIFIWNFIRNLVWHNNMKINIYTQTKNWKFTALDF